MSLIVKIILLGEFFIYPFTIMQCFFNNQISSMCDVALLKNKKDTQIFSYDDFHTEINYFHTENIHLFLFFLDNQPHDIIQFIKKLQNDAKYSNHPMALFSYKKEYLYHAFFELKPFQPVLLPISKKNNANLMEYIDFYYKMYQTSYKKVLEFDFSSCFYRFQIDDILFAEAKNRKVLIRTKDDSSIEIPITFHHLLEQIPENTLIQSHRSFIINPCNVSRIDKGAKHWTASFYNTNKKAFISRAYRQATLDIVFIHICKSNNTECYPMIDMYYFQ